MVGFAVHRFYLVVCLTILFLIKEKWKSTMYEVKPYHTVYGRGKHDFRHCVLFFFSYVTVEMSLGREWIGSPERT